MKNQTAVLWVVAFIAILAWVLLKDKDEVFIALAIPGVVTVAAGGRNRTQQQTVSGNSFRQLN